MILDYMISFVIYITISAYMISVLKGNMCDYIVIIFYYSLVVIRNELYVVFCVFYRVVSDIYI